MSDGAARAEAFSRLAGCWLAGSRRHWRPARPPLHRLLACLCARYTFASPLLAPLVSTCCTPLPFHPSIPRSPSLLPPSLSTRPALLRFASLCVSTAIVMRNWFRLRVWPTAQRPRGEEENKVAHTKRAALITANVPTSLAVPWPIGARRGRDLSGLANRGLG